MLGSLKIAQFVSVIFIAIGIIIFFYYQKKSSSKEDNLYRDDPMKGKENLIIYEKVR